MATRSTIALEYADGTVDQIYCHWDGYLEHNGRILQEHYKDPFKVRKLMDLGDVSSLAPSIEKPAGHTFDKSVDGYTVFYGRDRGETGVGSRRFKSFADYKANHQYEEFEYILRTDGRWYVCKYNGSYELLALAMAEEAPM